MQHEKIIRREDGCRVRITANFRHQLGKTEWRILVHKCAKGKRTWPRQAEYIFDDYGEPMAVYAEDDPPASCEEIRNTMLELWEKLKPQLPELPE